MNKQTAKNGQGNYASEHGWLAIRFPHLALNAANTRVFSKDEPIAIVSNQRVLQCNRAAVDLGVEMGMSENQVLMLEAQIKLFARDERWEREKINQLAYWAYSFSSIVSLYNQTTLALEVNRSVILFESLEILVEKIQNELDVFKLDYQLGLATTPKAAFLLSFQPNASFEELQSNQVVNALIQTLEVEDGIKNHILSCGFDTLGELATIPKPEIGARFGGEFLIYLEKLLGQTSDPQIPTAPPKRFDQSIDFAEPIQNWSWIETQIHALISQMLDYAEQNGVYIQEVEWLLWYSSGNPPTRFRLSLATSSSSFSNREQRQGSIFELTKLKLDGLTLEREFISIQLICTRSTPVALAFRDLFEQCAGIQEYEILRERLAARLGQNALYELQENREVPPESNTTRTNLIGTVKGKSEGRWLEESKPDDLRLSNASAQAYEPAWLFDHPKPLSMDKDRQPLLDGEILRQIHGPVRKVSHWWSEFHSRDYFICRGTSGELVWVFYDRVKKRWFLHGRFA